MPRSCVRYENAGHVDFSGRTEVFFLKNEDSHLKKV